MDKNKAKEAMTLKNFNVSDTVYILRMYRGRNTAPSISETKVKSIGRKYLIAGYRSQYKVKDFGDEENVNYLIENSSCGEESLLFKTRKEAEEHIEQHDLALWLGCFSITKAEKVSLEKLRKVKEILES